MIKIFLEYWPPMSLKLFKYLPTTYKEIVKGVYLQCSLSTLSRTLIRFFLHSLMLFAQLLKPALKLMRYLPVVSFSIHKVIWMVVILLQPMPKIVAFTTVWVELQCLAEKNLKSSTLKVGNVLNSSRVLIYLFCVQRCKNQHQISVLDGISCTHY